MQYACCLVVVFCLARYAWPASLWWEVRWEEVVRKLVDPAESAERKKFGVPVPVASAVRLCTVVQCWLNPAQPPAAAPQLLPAQPSRQPSRPKSVVGGWLCFFFLFAKDPKMEFGAVLGLGCLGWAWMDGDDHNLGLSHTPKEESLANTSHLVSLLFQIPCRRRLKLALAGPPGPGLTSLPHSMSTTSFKDKEP